MTCVVPFFYNAIIRLRLRLYAFTPARLRPRIYVVSRAIRIFSVCAIPCASPPPFSARARAELRIQKNTDGSCETSIYVGLRMYRECFRKPKEFTMYATKSRTEVYKNNKRLATGIRPSTFEPETRTDHGITYMYVT